MDQLAAIARIVLIAIFVVSGTAKLLDPSGTRGAVEQFRVPARFVGALARLLPFLELAIAAALLDLSTARLGGVAAFALLACFVIGIIRVLREGERPDCHCFGQLHSEPVGPSTLLRNAALMAAAALAVWQDGGRSLVDWQRDSPGVRAALVAVGVGLVAAIYSTARRSAGGTVAPPQGLDPGSTAPSFALPSPPSGEVRLDEMLGRGRSVVLLFVSPGCGPCQALLPSIAGWQRLERLGIAVLVAGTENDTAKIAETHGLRDTAVDERAVTRSAFEVRSTPGAVLLSDDGRVLAPAAVGSAAIERLILDALGLGDLVDGLDTGSVPDDDPSGDGAGGAISPADIDLAFRPQPRADVVFTRHNDDEVLVDQRTAGVHLLNPAAAVVWQIMGDDASIAELAVDVSEEFGAPLEEVRAQLVDVVRHFGQLGLLLGVSPAVPEPHEHAT